MRKRRGQRRRKGIGHEGRKDESKTGEKSDSMEREREGEVREEKRRIRKKLQKHGWKGKGKERRVTGCIKIKRT